MLTGNLDTIPASSVTDLVKTLLGLQTTDYDVVLEDFIDLAVQEFESPSIMDKQQECLTVCDGKAKLPCNFNEMIYLIPKGGGFYSQYIYVNLAVFKRYKLTSSLTSDCVSFLNTYQIENGHIWLHGNYEFDELEIYYRALNVGEDGLMRIYRTYKSALAFYCCYLFKAMQNDYKGSEFWLTRYRTKRRRIRGVDRSDEFEKDKSEIMGTLNAFMVAKTNYKFTAN